MCQKFVAERQNTLKIVPSFSAAKVKTKFNRLSEKRKTKKKIPRFSTTPNYSWMIVNDQMFRGKHRCTQGRGDRVGYRVLNTYPPPLRKIIKNGLIKMQQNPKRVPYSELHFWGKYPPPTSM